MTSCGEDCTCHCHKPVAPCNCHRDEQTAQHPGQFTIQEMIDMIGDHIDGAVVDRYAESRRNRGTDDGDG